MAAIESGACVTDAGPIIHLDELGALDLLWDFQPLLIPRVVWLEAVHHRPQLPPLIADQGLIIDARPQPSPRLQTLIESLLLGAGEAAALQLIEARKASLFLCDDAAARLAGESLGFTVHGTIGILLRSIRRGTRAMPEVLDTLRMLPERSTLHISRRLLTRIIETIQQNTS